MADIKALVVGTSFGVLTHARALAAAGITVVGLVGRNGAKARRRADLLGIQYAFTDLDEAFARPDVDLVVVATPPQTHASITLAAIDAGKHVLCEKPFAMDLAEGQSMLAAAESAGVIHVLGTEFRFTGAQALMRRVVRSGRIGEPRNAVFMLHLPSLIDPSTQLPGWWESAAQGGGWLGAHAAHGIDQLRSTIGEFAAVSGSLQTLSPRPAMTADDTYLVQFRLAGGCVGVLHSSCAIPGRSIATSKISGSCGAVWFQAGSAARNEQVWIDTGSGPERVPDPVDLPSTPPDPAPHELWPEHADKTRWHTAGTDLAPCTRLYERLRKRIRGEQVSDDPPLATFADGVANQAVLDAVRRSAAAGSWVDVEHP